MFVFPVSTGINRAYGLIGLAHGSVPRKYGDKPAIGMVGSQQALCSP
ncbi:conserved hypothetical protein [Xenorhabdus nematophila str. Anatoliense]|nr:conserved hypothetical protein [Xenorhabdus nematophila str. Anatoliense]